MVKNILIDIKGLITSDDIFNVEIRNWSKGDSYDLVIISDMKKLLKIRANDDYVPIIFLAEKYDKEEAIFFYKNGGDDYLLKSIDKDILNIKLKLLTRYKPEEKPVVLAPEYRIGRYIINTKNKQLFYSGELISSLRKKDVKLLTLFAKNINKVVSMEQIQDCLWDGDRYSKSKMFTLRMHILHTKQLLNRDHKVFILNIFEDGYKLIVRKD
jgi:DNA-binding response OmpR family regulator